MKIKFIASIIIFFLFAFSVSLKANENRGAELVIQKTDGHQIRGELIAVKTNSILLLESESAADVSVGIVDIEVVRVLNEPKVFARSGLGLLIGAGTGALMALIYGSDRSNNDSEMPYRVRRTASKKALDLGIFFGLIGTVSGGIAGAFEGADETIQIGGRPLEEIKEVLEKLSFKARVPGHN